MVAEWVVVHDRWISLLAASKLVSRCFCKLHPLTFPFILRFMLAYQRVPQFLWPLFSSIASQCSHQSSWCNSSRLQKRPPNMLRDCWNIPNYLWKTGLGPEIQWGQVRLLVSRIILTNQSTVFKLGLPKCQSMYFIHLLLCKAIISLGNQTTSKTFNGHEPVKQTLDLKYFWGDWYTWSMDRDMAEQKDPED